MSFPPPSQGLYNPGNEHDACGMGFVVDLNGKKSHEIIRKGIEILINLTHRGACGCDPETGDGAGILIQIPHEFFVRECAALGFSLPDRGEYGVGMMFLPVEPQQRLICEGIVERIAREEGLHVLGWRDTPVLGDTIGRQARATQPYIEQVFIRGNSDWTQDELERKLYVVRRRAEAEVGETDIRDREFFYVPSLSSRTIVYKGLLLAPQISDFYKELSDPETRSSLCMVHQRFSTNTFPAWKLAHPYRMICHNGEINTVRGNINWMHARESVLASDLFGDDIEKIFPVIPPGGSDTASLDAAVELLTLAGRSLPHVMAMLIPEAWDADTTMSPEKRAFYEYHASLMEPWDGPAAVAFTDGKWLGATLDRNGLRPARYLVTKDGRLILASETGVLPVKPEEVSYKGRLQPGKMLLVDLEHSRYVPDEEIKHALATRQPYGEWLEKNQISLDDLPDPPRVYGTDSKTLQTRQRAFGYTEEDLRLLLTPMASGGEEPIGSMGVDTPLACLSDKPQALFNYFKQLFAQVTNPAIDPIREELVMSLTSYIGSERNILEETAQHCHTLKLQHPILTNRDLEKLRRVSWGDFLGTTLQAVFRTDGGGQELERALDGLCRRASLAIRDGYKLLILSDRGVDHQHAPIPSLLALTAVHNHLVRERTRTQVALIIESGEPREVMHFCLLIGYGASAVNPYLAIETLEDQAARGHLPAGVTFETALKNYKKSINKGLLKVCSKMGISTLQSYRGAQVFEAIGLNKSLIERYFTGTASRIEGVGLDVLAREAAMKHEHAYRRATESETELQIGGDYQYRSRGEYHLFNPATVSKLQHAVRQSSFATFQEYTQLVDNQSRELCTLRGLMKLKEAAQPIPIEEVEPASEIVKRFATGAMSFGSISKEAHETLAIAMNRIGGRSNTGEGGEDEARFERDVNGDWRRSAIKQVASGRFGVTTNYLINAEELQIKVAQGAKPGEGGQLPGHKVDEVIARVRHSIPGVPLISPPPHHDIYSIEDLSQLIYDLKNVNPKARISVKLVAEAGVGTVAAGVAKAHADVVLISGHDGGTGASPLTSIKHAGTPWELGVAETQQTLVANNLRSRIVLRTDGGMRTGIDIITAAIIGAEEFNFGTAALIATGCVYVRQCHLNTCPVGVATQDEKLRGKFKGTPEMVVNFFNAVAAEVREILASLGVRKLTDIIGHPELLKQRHVPNHPKANTLNLKKLLANMADNEDAPRYCTRSRNDGVHERPLDDIILQDAKDAITEQQPISLSYRVTNVNRSVGTKVSGEIGYQYGEAGLPEGTLELKLEGSAGQSFGTFLAPGIRLILEGEANDYVGKGMSGGEIIVKPSPGHKFVAGDNSIVGNTCIYGATGGTLLANGRAGERFGVRNSGATAVVEGVGDHGCEYMTGGTVVVLGRTGKNFGAGMTGGLAYVLDVEERFGDLYNPGLVGIERLNDEDKGIVQQLIYKHL